jgi:hypothetical protein
MSRLPSLVFGAKSFPSNQSSHLPRVVATHGHDLQVSLIDEQGRTNLLRALVWPKTQTSETVLSLGLSDDVQWSLDVANDVKLCLMSRSVPKYPSSVTSAPQSLHLIAIFRPQFATAVPLA